MSRYPVLTFHSIDQSTAPISMPPAEFATVMRQLAAAGWQGVTLSEALARWSAGEAARCFGISFDDGYESVRAVALPLLRELGFRATVFVITDRCGGDNAWAGQPGSIPRMPLLGWEGLEALIAAGWEIGSHGTDHRPFTALDDAAVIGQLEGALEAVERHLGVEMPLIAYPYGAHDARVRQLVRRFHRAAFGVRLAAASSAELAAADAIPRIDAYYLRSFSPRLGIGSPLGRAYLAFRRWARLLRGSDWDAKALNDAGDR